MGAGWTHIWREEFKVHKLKLLVSKPELLLQPRWDIPPLVWLLYRCFMLVYTFSWLIYTALVFNTPKFLIFLSHISYCLMVIYYLLALCNLVWAFWEVRRSSHRIKTGVRGQTEGLLSPPRALSAALGLQWLLHSVTGCGSLTVTVIYWTLIHFSDRDSLTAFDVHIHAINSVQTGLDLLLSSTPVHLAHFCYPALAGVLYLLFVVVYWLTGGTNLSGQPYIYSIIDFSGRPLVASLCVLGVCLLCLPSCQAALWAGRLLRDWAARRDSLRARALGGELWWGKVSGGATFDLVPSPDPAASGLEA